MPELPEVELTRRAVAPFLVGRRVASVTAGPPGPVYLTSPAVLRRRLPGRVCRTLERRGKHLVALLDDGSRLLVHLGMTGQLFPAGRPGVRLLSSSEGGSLAPEAQLAFAGDRHVRLRLRFGDAGPDVILRDVRKLGRVQLLGREQAAPRLDRLGPDALAIRADELRLRAGRRRAPVKTVLLDQSVLAGVGNIYADEALFGAGLRPARPAASLPMDAWRRLTRALHHVLRRSLETAGSSAGEGDPWHDDRRVYGREGEPCRRCRAPVRRLVLGGRSSHFCPRCQR